MNQRVGSARGLCRPSAFDSSTNLPLTILLIVQPRHPSPPDPDLSHLPSSSKSNAYAGFGHQDQARPLCRNVHPPSCSRAPTRPLFPNLVPNLALPSPNLRSLSPSENPTPSRTTRSDPHHRTSSLTPPLPRGRPISGSHSHHPSDGQPLPPRCERRPHRVRATVHAATTPSPSRSLSGVRYATQGRAPAVQGWE
ncbi:hypothetical protein C8Q79DRAFT_143352 [Trametes meyenii]|nr:hypothetical protein C8Q79DRAFT_143352 [Trametes meyenii]